ncbi:glycosyltransferase family 2 protein [Paenibacillus sp. FSL F4-0243]|uniref:glycosyltransferase family 2 protein n=1 Tax=Paenibacillus sp. FSL F4-0243 TaxID=2954732 RepID=UPI0030D81480
MKKRVLLIIPAYNEQSNILTLLSQVNSLNITNVEMEYLVINDCSQDSTSLLCKEANATIVNLPCNLGIGGAVQTGYIYAYNNNFDIAIQVDGDGQHDPYYVKDLIAPIVKGQADFVIGSRYIEKKGFQSTVFRRMGISYFSFLIGVLYREKVTDPTSGFRACNKDIIKLFALNYPTDYPEPESIVYLLRNRYRVMEVAVTMKERVGGVSSIQSFKAVYYMFKVTLAVLIDTLRKRTIIEVEK